MMSPPKNREGPHSVEARWTQRLATQFVPISTYFLLNYHRLKPHDNAKGMSNSEAMLLIQLIVHKWGAARPYPSQETLATRMGVSSRRIRQILKSLKDTGYLAWDQRAYNSNMYDLTPLYDALERLMDEDESMNELVDTLISKEVTS
jgi:biotin operon repressor